MEISSPLVQVLCKEHIKPLNGWGYVSKTPIDVKETWNHQIYMMFRRIGGP